MEGDGLILRRLMAGNGVDWRWRRAGALLADGRRPDGLDDAATVAAWRFRWLARADGTAAADLRYPAVAAAVALRDADGPPRWAVDARLLAGAAPGAAAGGLPGPGPDALRAYADTFFAVAGRLRATDWLLVHAVRAGPGWPAGGLTEAAVWRYAAVAAGPVAVDLLVGDHLGLPDADPAARRATADGLRDFARLASGGPPDPALVRRVLRGLRARLEARRRAAGPKSERRALKLQAARLRSLAKFWRTVWPVPSAAARRRRDRAAAAAAGVGAAGPWAAPASAAGPRGPGGGEDGHPAEGVPAAAGAAGRRPASAARPADQAGQVPPAGEAPSGAGTWTARTTPAAGAGPRPAPR
jgi:hypothetical protein